MFSIFSRKCYDGTFSCYLDVPYNAERDYFVVSNLQSTLFQPCHVLELHLLD